MGLISSIIKGVSHARQVIRDLPGRLNRWDLSRDIKKELKKAEKQAETVAPDISAELAALRRQTEELQRQNDMLRRAIEAGGKYGNVKAANDPVKLANQQRVAEAIDEERENSGALPGTQEWEEARARALDKIRAADIASDFVDHSDPDTQVTLDLTEEEQAALDLMGDTPWEAL